MSRRGGRRRRRSAFVLFIIEFVLALIILAAILGVVAYFLCPLYKVKVTGTDLYTPEEIRGYILDDKYCGNTVYAFLKNKIHPKGDAEFIDSFDVKMTGRNSLTIICNEKPILGYIYQESDEKYVYFNYNGMITEISETYVDRGYMKVDGVSCEKPKVGSKLSIGESQIGYLTSLIKLLKKEDLMPNAIIYDDNGHITLEYDTYRIALGSSIYLEEKIQRVVWILPNIEGMYGTLHLEKFSNQNTDIVFEKDVDKSE